MASNENISPATIRRLMKEISDLLSNPPEGIKLIQNEEDVTDIQSIIDGPAGTPYEGGFFRIKLKLSPDFPSSPPKGYFVTKIFHPNVSAKGEICVNTLKKDWKPEHGIKHILLTVKCLLIVPNPESALNEEAGKLLLEKYEDYFKHAKLMTSIHASKKPGIAETPSTDNTNNTNATSSDKTEASSPKKRTANTKEAPVQKVGNLEKKKSLKRL
eukprot:CAMPEP_0168563966 /NCGR_PEP_ID=MMETSP0413-20121227/12968_1 /TAXON_ID=136452 /ORGANISM="Filamoeba nolandi, Strain NC-AS-23-1" /LENGTH=213 /DNA_ID=CAMNT_0008595555 /DNA_START=35 /DNA_END=676 /DNA_ORIENTATION=-